MSRRHDWTIHSRWFVAGEGWKESEVELPAFTLEEAWTRASAAARELDREYGDSHFWTVDVERELDGRMSSAVQLFHGRLA